jgi:putative ABC transport system ATP-binding protein
VSDLQVRKVRYSVGRPLLSDIELTFKAGEVTALSGPSGSGKTTLLSVMGGLIQPDQGSAEYGGADMWLGTGDPRPEVAFVLQVYGLIPILSARENVSVALRARGVAPEEADERATQALARFHIADLGDRQVEELSGGQMQRVACARGFVVGADILLADEPTSELDEANRELVLSELRQEAQRGSVVVVATHDPAVVAACDTHYMLDEGRVVDHIEAVHLDRDRPDGTAGHRHIGDEPRPVAPPEVQPETPSETAYAGRHTTPDESAPADGPAPASSGEQTDDWAFRRPADD